MYMTGQLSVSTPFAVGDLGSEHNEHRDSHAEPVSVELSEIELQPSILVGPDVRAEFEASPVCEANHLQDRCVDMAMELFALKTKFDEQVKELKWAKREGDGRERDFKEVQRLCEEERRSSRSFMRRVKALEEDNAKMSEANADLRLDKERLLGVLRRHREAGRSESMAAHRERLRRRHISEKEVNRCDLASAKLGLKAMGQENKRLVHKIRGQASRVRTLEEGTEALANKVADLEDEIDTLKEERDVATRKASEAQAAERRANSDMEHEALLRLEQVERASTAERAEEEAREATASMELVAESLRARLATAVEQLEAKDSARARHQGSVGRYQKMIDAQASALQAARQQLLGEKVRRQESERQARLRHIAAIDTKTRAAANGSTAAGDAKGQARQRIPGKRAARAARG